MVLGVAVGRSRSQLGLFDLEGREIAGDSTDHTVGIGPDELLPAVASRLAALLDGVDPTGRRIGMSLPGTVDPERRVSLDSPVMRGWDGVELAPYLSRSATPALPHQRHLGPGPLGAVRAGGAGQRRARVKASTGLGLGVIADGRLVNEHRGVTGELGHTRVDAAGDQLCRCGATGCLETIAGGWALVNRLQDRVSRPGTCATWWRSPSRATRAPATCCARAAGTSARCCRWR